MDSHRPGTLGTAHFLQDAAWLCVCTCVGCVRTWVAVTIQHVSMGITDRNSSLSGIKMFRGAFLTWKLAFQTESVAGERGGELAACREAPCLPVPPVLAHQGLGLSLWWGSEGEAENGGKLAPLFRGVLGAQTFA